MLFKKTTNLILAGSIAVASMGSAPARADGDFDKLAGFLIGAAILTQIGKDKNDDEIVARDEYNRDYDGDYDYHIKHYHTRTKAHNHGGYHRHKNGVLHRHPASKKRILALPRKCKRTIFYQSKENNTAYSVRCLKREGFKISKKGVVRHPDYNRREARPRLIR